jgi:diguanylate cyclase (GGDEF)-like protein/PAS domain S-box-containing protein
VLDETLQRNADILALGMQESLWNMNADAARSLVESVMRDPAVLHVQVRGQADTEFIDRRAAPRPRAGVFRAERTVVVRGQPIGRVLVEMDDSRSQQELRAKQWRYAGVLAVQLGVAAADRAAPQAPPDGALAQLTGFSDRLSRGDFDTPLVLSSQRRAGAPGRADGAHAGRDPRLFADIGRREERFRTIVTQVPGAVFRARPGGRIDFVSDAIEAISGYPARMFMRHHRPLVRHLIAPEDRRMQRRLAQGSLLAGAVRSRIPHRRCRRRRALGAGERPAGGAGRRGRVLGRRHHLRHQRAQAQRDAHRGPAGRAGRDAGQRDVRHDVQVRDLRIVSTNRRFEELFGYARGLTGASIASLFPTAFETVRAAGAASIRRCAAATTSATSACTGAATAACSWCHGERPRARPGPPNGGSIWVYADVTERRQAEEKLRLSATVLEHIADGVMVIDVHGIIVATNPAFTQITGYTESRGARHPPGLTRQPGQQRGPRPAFYDSLWRDLATPASGAARSGAPRKNGEVYLEWLTVSAVRDDAGEVTHYVCVFSDITKLKESQEKLDHLAHHDPLTALPNRLLFHDRLQHAMVRAARDGEQLAVMFIDLDRFKNVNDTLGHHVGDELLKQVAKALSGCLRDGDTLARLGGDEFIVLLEDVDGERGARLVAEKLMRLFEQPVHGVRLRAVRHRQRRHQPVPAGCLRPECPGPQRRRRHVPGQGARPQRLQPSTRRRWTARASSACAWKRCCAARSRRTRSGWPTSRRSKSTAAA